MKGFRNMVDFYKINRYVFKKISGKKSLVSGDSYTIQKEILDEVYKRNFKNDYFVRSYCQYLCQKKLYNQNYIFLNIISLVCILIILLFSIFLKARKIEKEDMDYVVFGVMNKIPDEFMEYKLIGNTNKISFKSIDIIFYLKEVFFKCKGNFFFSLKILLKIGIYRYNIDRYKPKGMLVTSEYSYTSSILTLFCEKNGVLHINYMHGEKIYEIVTSFFKFHKCYIWDEHYKNLFKKLYADPDQFIICDYKNILFREIKEIKWESREEKNITYYLQAEETREDVEKVIKILKFLENKTGLKGKIRCHPIYTSEKIKELINNDMLDNEKNVYSSLIKSKYIIAKNSTVLYEGTFFKEKIIVVDNIGRNYSKFLEMRNLDWIVLKKDIKTLSSLLLEVEYND